MSDYVIKTFQSSDGMNVHLRGEGPDENGYADNEWPIYKIELFKWGEVDKTLTTLYNYSQALNKWKNVVNIIKNNRGKSKMGKSRTAVYQIGRVYKINGYMYRALSEQNNRVKFINLGPAMENDKGLWINKDKIIFRKQQYR